MKGVIFQAYVDFVRDRFGDKIYRDVASDRTILATHNYDDGELTALLKKTADLTGMEPSSLLREFGVYFVDVFAARKYPMFYRNKDFVSFVLDVDRIHDVVTRTMPGAAPPHFTYEKLDDRNLIVTYHSRRMLDDLVVGLLEGAARHFGVDVDIRREAGDKNAIKYRISLLNHQ